MGIQFLGHPSRSTGVFSAINRGDLLLLIDKDPNFVFCLPCDRASELGCTRWEFCVRKVTAWFLEYQSNNISPDCPRALRGNGGS